MKDIINILPENVANQIAAGEVVQRPASVVKELLENSIDAKAKEIKILIKDAGKTMIQVIDNGVGMSKRDVSICFDRHTTSKFQMQKIYLILSLKALEVKLWLVFLQFHM